MAEPTTPPSRRKPTHKRTPGRPRGESQDLRPRLLDAALACYARDGIAATSLSGIAAEAGVTGALLYYYFGDKTQLTQAVIEERLMPAFATVRDSVLRAGDDVFAMVAAFVHGMYETVQQHPLLPQLWVREVLCEGGALRDVVLARTAPQLPQLLAQRFAAAQREGRLNPKLDPRLLVTSLMGLTMLPAASKSIWLRLYDADDIDTKALSDHAIALLDYGIRVE